MTRRPDLNTDSSPRLLAAARTLAVDALAAEAIDALRAEGVRSILLEGPAVAQWLYADGAFPGYDGCDLLIDPGDRDLAGIVLAKLGFTLARDGSWTRGHDEDVVDLHDSLPGAMGDGDVVWRLLSARTDPVVIAGTAAEMLDAPRRALVVALHAAAYGADGGRPLEDLRRALDLLEPRIWRRASRVALRIGARGAFVDGLRLLPAGRVLAGTLRLQPPPSREVRIHASTIPNHARFLEALAKAERAQRHHSALTDALRAVSRRVGRREDQ